VDIIGTVAVKELLKELLGQCDAILEVILGDVFFTKTQEPIVIGNIAPF